MIRYAIYTLFLSSLLLLESCGSDSGSGRAEDQNKEEQEEQAVKFISNREDFSFNKDLTIQTLKFLASDELEGRKPGTQGHEKAQAYIKRQFKAIGLKPLSSDYEQPFTVKLRGEKDSVQASNILGFIKGTYHAEQYIVIGAHYDHVGIKDGEIYNGADDNASGVGALLAIADYFSNNPPGHSLLFLAFDAEESGLQGAKFFVDNPMVDLKDIAMMINMDMISRNDKGELYASGTHHYPYLKDFLKKAERKKEQISLRLGHDKPSQGGNDWTMASDHAPFHKAKIPFIYFGVEDHEHYHQPTDDFETINQDFYLSCVELILQSVRYFDDELGIVERRGKSGVGHSSY